MKRFYILLTRTETVPARVIRRITGAYYSHTSFSIYPRTDHFYSYARRHVDLPIFAGFVSENIHTKVFARYPLAPCVLYSIEVSDETYEKAKKLLRYFRAHRRQATYSFLGAYAMPFGLPIKRMNKFTCSQFVAFVLHYSGACELPKDPYLMMPDDFGKIENIETVYEGPLKDCNFGKIKRKNQKNY
ncbi:MAG: hypothetical protein E7642_01280 [Ruminococcaceae bacterium]|nr:hypothetical protein [Oscillospiraceae bacterium]